MSRLDFRVEHIPVAQCAQHCPTRPIGPLVVFRPGQIQVGSIQDEIQVQFSHSELTSNLVRPKTLPPTELRASLLFSKKKKMGLTLILCIVLLQTQDYGGAKLPGIRPEIGGQEASKIGVPTAFRRPHCGHKEYCHWRGIKTEGRKSDDTDRTASDRCCGRNVRHGLPSFGPDRRIRCHLPGCGLWAGSDHTTLQNK